MPHVHASSSQAFAPAPRGARRGLLLLAVLGVAALPPVVTSPKVRAPVAAGLLRPWIILPMGLAESLASDSLRDVLVHECAHVVRLDA